MQASDLTKFKFAVNIAGPYCSACCSGGAAGPAGPTGPTGPAGTWSQYPATQSVDLSCNALIDVSGIYFCDTAYMVQNPVGELLISNAANDISMVADSVITTRFIQTSTEPYPLSLYVSKSGNDTTGTGSESNPFLTIQKAITVAETLPSSSNPFEIPIIYVDEGFYDEKLTITKNLTIIGIGQYLANNQANYGGQHSTRIGSVANNNFVDIRSAVAGHIVRFENLDFRCRITNLEAGTPVNAVALHMNYCNINKSSDPNPIMYISGVSVGTPSTVFVSNTRSNGTTTSATLAPYELPNTNLNMEECRWNGTASAIGMMRLTHASIFINSELRQISVGAGITNLPTIILNFAGGFTTRFSNTVLSLEYSGTKTVGANILTIPSGAPFASTPTLILDDCYMNIRATAIATNYILQNSSGKNINLQFHRVNSMSTNTGSGVIDYTNIIVADPGAIITSTSNFLGGANFASTFQLPATLTAASLAAGVISFNVASNSILAGSVTVSGVITGLTITNARIGGQYQLYITSSGASTINNTLTGGVKTNYAAPVILAGGETAVMTILYDGVSYYVSASRYV